MTPQLAKAQKSLLVDHFLGRLLESELVSKQAEARVTLIQILAILTVPGFVISALLINKYAALANGHDGLAALAALNDKCRFLFFSMVVMGLVTVLEWDALFPDRRDFLILSPLPVGSGTLLRAKVQSLLQFLLLFSVFVNLIPAILFPFIAGGGSLAYLGRFAFSHVFTVFAGNAFVFFSLITVQGVLMNLLGTRAFKRISRLVQFLLLILLLTVFFVMPLVSFTELRKVPRSLEIFPPAWFLGLYETLLSGTTPEFARLAGYALTGFISACFGFACTYLISYRKHVRRSLEGERLGTQGKAAWLEWLRSRFLCLVFRSPGERATVNFMYRTLLSSEKHRICFGAYLGVGIALAAMGVITVVARHGYGALYQLRQELLSIPLVLVFFTLVGMRVSFSFPAQLGANWVFRLTEQKDKQPYLEGVHKAMFLIGVLPVLGAAAPLCVALWGWRACGLHVLFVLTMALLLMEVLLFRLDKIPFTCTYLPGKANLKMMILPYMIAFTTYAYTMTTIERRLMTRPVLFSGFIVSACLVLAVSARYRQRKLGARRSFVYDILPARVAEPLSLSQY